MIGPNSLIIPKRTKMSKVVAKAILEVEAEIKITIKNHPLLNINPNENRNLVQEKNLIVKGKILKFINKNRLFQKSIIISNEFERDIERTAEKEENIGNIIFFFF